LKKQFLYNKRNLQPNNTEMKLNIYIIIKCLTAYWRNMVVFPVFEKELDSTGLHLLRPNMGNGHQRKNI
jgi:hypothetical protein